MNVRFKEMGVPKTAALVAALLFVLAVAAFAAYLYSGSPVVTPTLIASSHGGTASSQVQSAVGSTQVENRTIVAAYVSALPASAAGSTSVTNTVGPGATNSTFTQTQPSPPSNSFSYAPSSEVKVLSVTAQTSQSGSGNRSVVFSVQYQNVGSSPIYVLGGGGSSLSVDSLTGAAIANQTVKFRCEIPVSMTAVGPGENHTSSVPGCWSGYAYSYAQPGTVYVQLTLAWATSLSPGSQVGSLEITAEFALG